MISDLLQRLGRLYWRWFPQPVPESKGGRMLPEDLGEERIMSLEMHYGDEPLYYSEPPEWPWEATELPRHRGG